MNIKEVLATIESVINKLSYIISLAYHKVFSDPAMMSEVMVMTDENKKRFSFVGETGDMMLQAMSRYEQYRGEELTKKDQ